jgi:hypothetical protein
VRRIDRAEQVLDPVEVPIRDGKALVSPVDRHGAYAAAGAVFRPAGDATASEMFYSSTRSGT